MYIYIRIIEYIIYNIKLNILIQNVCLFHRTVCLHLYSNRCFTVPWEAHTKTLKPTPSPKDIILKNQYASKIFQVHLYFFHVQDQRNN